jgi:hypothetical protein
MRVGSETRSAHVTLYNAVLTRFIIQRPPELQQPACRVLRELRPRRPQLQAQRLLGLAVCLARRVLDSAEHERDLVRVARARRAAAVELPGVEVPPGPDAVICVRLGRDVGPAAVLGGRAEVGGEGLAAGLGQLLVEAALVVGISNEVRLRERQLLATKPATKLTTLAKFPSLRRFA